MAVVDVSRVASALATVFQDEIVEQVNRSVVLLQLLPFGEAIGQNIQWDAEFAASGEATDSTIADGADVSVFQDDDVIPAVLQYATYSEAFKITGKARAIAAAARNPNELADLFGEKMSRAIRRLTKNIAKDIYNGNGASNKMAGLIGASALLATGTYAGIDRATYTGWAGNELANGGVARALAFSLMRTMMRTIYEASGEYPDVIVCDALQHEKFGSLFDGTPFTRQLAQDVRLRGGKITLEGGYQALMWDGIPVIADVNCPAGKMLFLNSNYVKVRQLKDLGPDAVTEAMGQVTLQGTPEAQLKASATRLTAMINPLDRKGDAYPFQLKLYPQIQVERPNACGVLSDLALS